MSETSKQALLLIAITVCLVLVIQPNALCALGKRQEAPRRVLSQAEMQLFTTTANSGEIVMVGANGVLIDQGSQALRVGTGGITLITNNTERINVLSNGKVGIGITDPSAKLHVQVDDGDAWTTPIKIYQPNISANPSAIYGPAINLGKNGSCYNNAGLVYRHVSDGNIKNYVGLGIGCAADSTLVVNGDNLVGIGTTDPKAKLHINEPNIDLWNTILLGPGVTVPMKQPMSQILVPENVISGGGALNGQWVAGRGLYLSTGTLIHDRWGGDSYGPPIVIRQWGLKSRADNGSAGYTHYGGDIYIDSGPIVGRKDGGTTSLLQAGSIYLRTGNTYRVNSEAEVNNQTVDWTTRMIIRGRDGAVGIGTEYVYDNCALTIDTNFTIKPRLFKVGGTRGTYYKVRIAAMDGLAPSKFTIIRSVHMDGLWQGSVSLRVEFRGQQCGNGAGHYNYEYNIYNFQPEGSGISPNYFVARATDDQGLEGGCTGSNYWVYLNGNASYYFTGENCYLQYWSPNGVTAGDTNPTMPMTYPFNEVAYIGSCSYNSTLRQLCINGNLYIEAPIFYSGAPSGLGSQGGFIVTKQVRLTQAATVIPAPAQVWENLMNVTRMGSLLHITGMYIIRSNSSTYTIRFTNRLGFTDCEAAYLVTGGSYVSSCSIDSANNWLVLNLSNIPSSDTQYLRIDCLMTLGFVNAY